MHELLSAIYSERPASPERRGATFMSIIDWKEVRLAQLRRCWKRFVKRDGLFLDGERSRLHALNLAFTSGVSPSSHVDRLTSNMGGDVFDVGAFLALV